MKREIRDKRYILYRASVKLREIAGICEDCNKSETIRKEQDKFYKKWCFYNNIIKASDKIK